MICGNCGATHGCNCQSKIASDGRAVCSSCIAAYEVALNQQRQASQGNVTPNNPVNIQIQSITYNHNYTG